MKKWSLFYFLGLFLVSFVVFGGKLWINSLYYNENAISVESAADRAEKYDPKDTPIVVMGNSQMLALDPLQIEELTGKRITNLSGGGNDETAYLSLLRKVLANGKPEKVYLQLSPLTLGGIYKAAKDVRYRNARYTYDRVDAEEFNAYNSLLLLLYNDTRFMKSRWFNVNFSEIWARGMTKIKDLQRMPNRADLFATLDHHRGYLIYWNHNWLKGKEKNGLLDFSLLNSKTNKPRNPKKPQHINKNTIAVFDNIENLLEENGVDYQYIWAPEQENINNKEDTQTYLEPLGLLLEALDSEKVVDLVFFPQEHFKDPEHLNYDGSRIFGEVFSSLYLDYNAEENDVYELVDLSPFITNPDE